MTGPNKKQPPKVDPALLEPIEGIPQKANQMLVALAAQENPDLSEAAETVGLHYHTLWTWRKKHPAFNERLSLIYDERINHTIDTLKKNYWKALTEGVTETWTEERADGSPYIRTRHHWDLKAMAHALAKFSPAEWGDDQAKDDGQTSFSFDPSGGNKELEAGEIVEETE